MVNKVDKLIVNSRPMTKLAMSDSLFILSNQPMPRNRLKLISHHGHCPLVFKITMSSGVNNNTMWETLVRGMDDRPSPFRKEIHMSWSF